jgi:sigma-B regulation protein RsbU (phosphoserine phosphatase)
VVRALVSAADPLGAEQLERRDLEEILESIAEAITVEDRHGRIVYANRAAAMLIGTESASELIGAEPGSLFARFEIFDEQGRTLALDDMPGRRLFRGEDRGPLLARTVVRATGAERWILARSTPIHDRGTGEIRWAVNVFDDVSEVKRSALAEHDIVKMLERSLLPAELPNVPGLEVAVAYRAAGENAVGGDFYDVVLRDDGCWVAFVGDVCGKGPRAAGVTGLARHTLRAVAMTKMTSRQMLTTLHRALKVQPPRADLCTVCMVTLPRPPRMSARVALAGHPAPMVVTRRGRVRGSGPRPAGTVLGVVDPIRIAEYRVPFRPGDTLLLYTDGITEAGAPEAPLGGQRLATHLRSNGNGSLQKLLDSTLELAVEHSGGTPRDDLAVLGIRRHRTRESRGQAPDRLAAARQG